MAETLKAALIRFPHLEDLLGASIELAGGALLRVEETPDDLGFENSADFHVWELPIVRYIAGRESGFGVTALPVFTTRRFIQWMIELPEDSDIQDVKDLEGKRIVQRYNGNTDSTWTKGLLRESYGVDLSNVSWFTIKPERVPGHEPPEGVTCIPGSDPIGLLRNGVVDASLASGHGGPTPPGVRRLWSHPETEAAKWYAATGIFPILHLIVVRDSVLAAQPWLADELYQLFDQTKAKALDRWDYGATLPEDRRAKALWSGFPGSAWEGSDRAYLGRDPLPYGLDGNVETLELIIRYAFEQGAINRMHEVEELFAIPCA